jgi:hypothetical protein
MQHTDVGYQGNGPSLNWQHQFVSNAAPECTPKYQETIPDQNHLTGWHMAANREVNAFSGLQPPENSASVAALHNSISQPTNLTGNFSNIVSPSSASTTTQQAIDYLPSHAAAASATLFGVNTSIGAYDLSAPAAAKANSSGNPFA